MRDCGVSDFSLSKDDETDQASALIELFGSEDAKHVIDNVLPNFLCFDVDETYLQGNVHTISGSAITMLLNRCTVDERETCKSEEEYYDWIKDKSIVVFNS